MALESAVDSKVSVSSPSCSPGQLAGVWDPQKTEWKGWEQEETGCQVSHWVLPGTYLLAHQIHWGILRVPHEDSVGSQCTPWWPLPHIPGSVPTSSGSPVLEATLLVESFQEDTRPSMFWVVTWPLGNRTGLSKKLPLHKILTLSDIG
jgi:hypothetical protein